MKSKSINLNDLIEGKNEASDAPKETALSKPKAIKNIVIKKKKKKAKIPSFLMIIIAVLIFALVTAGTFVFFSIRNIESSVNTLKESSKSLLEDITHQDLTQLDQHSADISTSLNTIRNELDSYNFLADIPLTKGYYDNLVQLKDILQKADSINKSSTIGLKDILKSETGGGDKTIVTLTKHLPEFIALYNTVEPDIISILNDTKKIDVNYIPLNNYKESVKTAQSIADEYPSISSNVKEFLKYMPDLLGSGKETTYMLLLQSTSEMRSSGGLLTTVGHASILNGQVNNEISLEDSWNLEKLIENIQADPYNPINADPGYRNIWGQRFLMSKNCGPDFLRFQDVGIYPDLYMTMNMAKDYYNIGHEADPATYPSYDYVVILDDAFAENMLKLIQPITVDGYPGEVTADSLYNFIKKDTDDPKNDNFNPNKKEIIKKLANVVKEKFLNLPLSDLPKVMDTIIQSFKARSLGIANFENQDIQALFDKYGMSGRTINNYNGDYFQLSEAQNCSKKLNKWVRDSITQDVFIDDGGSIKKEVHVNWEQPQVYDPNTMTDSMYDLSGNFIYRAWVRLMLPKDVSDIVSDGQNKYVYPLLQYNPEQYYDEDLQKEISDNVISFDHRRMSESDPIRTADLLIAYQLPSELNYLNTGEYKMLIQKHPGKSWGEHTLVNIHQGDKTYTADVVLDEDKVLTFKDGTITVENYNKAWDWLKKLNL